MPGSHPLHVGIIAGEASGDNLGAALIHAIRSKPGMVLQVNPRIRTRPLHAAMLVAACTSLTMELGQIAFADRIPALPDLILNLSGGLLGAILFSRIQPAYRD